MIDARKDVILVNMPFASPERPSLPLGILAAILRRDGVSISNIQGNLHLFKYVDSDLYTLIGRVPPELGLADWLFSKVAFPDFESDPNEYLELLMDMVPQLFKKKQRAHHCKILLALRSQVDQFVEEIAVDVQRYDPRIVGCTSTYQQHVASLALLKRIKDKSPNVVTIIGGANCETEMGVATHKNFEFIDYVVSGEADELITPLVRNILDHGKAIPSQAIPFGVFAPQHRSEGYPKVDNEMSECQGESYPRATVDDLSNAPVPDYDDYFRVMAELPEVSNATVFALPLESSRGCFWGKCRFCGLNGQSETHRAKPLDNVLKEINTLADRYHVNRIQFVDNAVHPDHMPELFDRLIKQGSRYKIFYEVRTVMKKEDFSLMSKSGAFWVQPGIESLHTSILRTMRKGTAAWQNIQYLKWARQYGLKSIWKIMFGFPNDEDVWYHEMAETIPLLHHMEPPTGINQLRFDRFSSYYNSQDEYKLHLVPSKLMKWIYPLKNEELANLSYFFDDTWLLFRKDNILFQSDNPEHLPGYKEAHAAIREWQRYFFIEDKAWPVLMIVNTGPCLQIVDTRRIATASFFELNEVQSRVYLQCDAAQTRESLFHKLKTDKITDAEIETAIEYLLENKLMISIDGRLLSLAVTASCFPLPKTIECPNGWVNEIIK